MRILHVSPSYKPAYHYGGPTISVSRLAEAQAVAGAIVSVYTTTADGQRELPVVPGKAMEMDGVSVRYFRRWTGDHGHFSPPLLWQLWQHARDYDVVHIHSWWNWVAFGAVMICRMRKVHTVLSPHGMLSPYTLSRRSRRIFQRFAGNWLLRDTHLHATSWFETRELNRIAPSIPTEMVHNIVELPLVGQPAERPPDAPFRLLFISRVHPKKGLDLMLEALPALGKNWELVIAGSGERNYERKLKIRAKKLGISGQIQWIGWVAGADKWQLIKDSDLMVLPSHNENFAIVVVEALALGLPVLISDQVGLSDYVLNRNFGWVSIRTEAAMCQALQSAMDANEKRRWIRQFAPQQIPVDFNPATLAVRYFSMYRKIKGLA